MSNKRHIVSWFGINAPEEGREGGFQSGYGAYLILKVRFSNLVWNDDCRLTAETSAAPPFGQRQSSSFQSGSVFTGD